YPTVALNLDVKRNLPAEGADWLFVRVRAGEIRNGRMDLQIIVLDRAGDLVALSSHISLVMSSERNLVRSPQEGSGKL
ncbi:thioesterase family protein, partial [Candidatus Bathyarchaeota archaeon]|nr:thioesterase family protein [Candidatus Bathyarchaeota archaeon]